MSRRRYGQFCPLAKALDVLGERWTLLIVRELLAGPKRYTDLRAGLPGLATDLLATRLRELQEAGVVDRHEVPPPTPATVYELTERGRALLAGPRANGFATEMWTLARVAAVIERVTGVRYSQTQTWAVLRERLGGTRQRPARRAVERNEEAVAAWVKLDWPRVKKAPGAAAPGSASKMRAGSRSSRQ